MFVPSVEFEITPTARGAKPVWLLMAEGGSEEECVGTPVSLLLSAPWTFINGSVILALNSSCICLLPVGLTRH